MPISPINVSKNAISPVGGAKSSTSTFVNIARTPFSTYTTVGSPMGLLLSLTYAVSSIGNSSLVNISKN